MSRLAHGGITMKKFLAPLSLALVAASPAHAVQIDVEIINLTRGSYFTSFMVTADDGLSRSVLSQNQRVDNPVRFTITRTQ
jgi:hypothetical protein